MSEFSKAYLHEDYDEGELFRITGRQFDMAIEQAMHDAIDEFKDVFLLADPNDILDDDPNHHQDLPL